MNTPSHTIMPWPPHLERAYSNFNTNLSYETPRWIQEERQKSLKRLLELGIPKKKQEEWRDSRIPMAFQTPWEYFVGANLIEGLRIPEDFTAHRHLLVFVNGQFSRELSAFDELRSVIEIEELPALLRSPQHDLLRRSIHRVSNDIPVLLNQTFLHEGPVIQIPQNAVIDAPIHILHLMTPEMNVSMLHPRVIIDAAPFSKATIVESTFGIESSQTYFLNTVTDLSVRTGAHVNYIRLQQDASASTHIGTVRADLSQYAVLNTTLISLGANVSRHNISVQLNEEGASTSLNGLYALRRNQQSDIRTSITHHHGNTTCHQIMKGILQDTSHGLFHGHIHIDHRAQKVEAQQLSRALLLSNEARAHTEPHLEIFADDVKCAHGTTVGQIGRDELFYLQSRGIDPERAQRMLLAAFAHDICIRIENDDVRQWITPIVHRYLGDS